MHSYIKGIYKILNEHRNEENALPMKKYMRNQFDFFGIKAAERRLLCNEYLKNNPLPERKELPKIIKELWSLDERELQYFAIELFIKCKKNWIAEDATLIEYLVTHKSWWDTVDFLAALIAGGWFKKFPEEIKPLTEKWNTSDNIWLQRTSILFQLKYKEDTDLKLLTKYIKRLSSSKELFIQKAIGWSLREYSKTDPEFVQTFVDNEKLMPLSKREAMKVIERKKK